jgi:hypothetical protein
MDPSLATDCTSFIYFAEILMYDESVNDLSTDNDCKLTLLLISYNYKLFYKAKSDTTN